MKIPIFAQTTSFTDAQLGGPPFMVGSGTSHPKGWVTRIVLATMIFLLINSVVVAQEKMWSDTIRIEIDYMVMRDVNDNIIHSHKPQPIEVAAVIQMFACQNILCIIDVSDEVWHYETMTRDPFNPGNFFNYYGLFSYGSIKNAFRDHFDCWHYCVFGHAYQNSDYEQTSSSGLGEIGGDEFIVTLGLWDNDIGEPFERAATLAHELGHNLGLRHAGDMDAGVTGPNTPNFPSTMSYFCQVVGVKWKYENKKLVPTHSHFLKNLDYSRARFCGVNENSLDERFGVGTRKIDWDCSGYINSGTVAQDLNKDTLGHWCESSGDRGYLYDHNDWAHYEDQTCLWDQKAASEIHEISCITYEEFDQFKKEHPEFRAPPVEIEPCNGNRMIFAVPSIGGSGQGYCDSPYKGFMQGYNSAWSGDILYLKYGVYNVASPTIFLNKRMIITATDAALIRPVGKGAEGK